jgi:uridine phosphorylase
MCGVGEIAEYVLISGDPQRIERIAGFFDESVKVGDYRGFVTYRGNYGGVDISASSTGIGGASSAIVVEELARLGAKTFIRVGTTGSLQPAIDVGDLVVATGAARDRGSTSYAPSGYPAVADFYVTSALLNAAKDSKKKIHSGLVLTTDAFYGNDEMLRRWSKLNILSVEMECSTIFALAEVKKLRAGAILAVDSKPLVGLQKGEFEPGQKTGELNESVQEAIDEEIRISLEAVMILENKPKKNNLPKKMQKQKRIDL